MFQVDLFSARSALLDIQEVLARHKDIVYSSRTRHNTDVYKQMNNLKADLYKALRRFRRNQLSEQMSVRLRDRLADLPEITILQMIYQQKAYEGAIPRIMNSPPPRCASTGKAAWRTPAGR